MRHSLLSVAIAAAFSCSPTAYAVTCYIVLDRTDTVLFRDTVPPVDLSERGGAARAALRRRGEFMLTMDSDRCSSFIATSNAAGAGGASVEEIVAGMRSYAESTGGGGSTPNARTSSVAAPSAPSAAAAPARSARRGY